MSSASKQYPALPGFYNALFLYIEPISTILPSIMIYLIPGAAWFHHQLIPSDIPLSADTLLDPRSKMAVWQLANCYGLLGMISSFVFRAARNALPNDLEAQERVTGALLAALAIADVTHILASFFGLPKNLQLNPVAWNGTTHGNITVVIFLFALRMMWFMGIGRTSYYYGRSKKVKNN